MKKLEYFQGCIEYHVWPGGYPKYLVMADGSPMCMNCANEEGERIMEAYANPTDLEWLPEEWAVNWEDPFLHCCHCGALIESAYGEDEDEPE